MATASDSFRHLSAVMVKKMEYTRDVLAVVGLACIGKIAIETSVTFLNAFRVFLLSKSLNIGHFQRRICWSRLRKAREATILVPLPGN